MKSLKVNKYYLIGLLFLLTSSVFSQNLSSLESYAAKVRKQITLESSKLDSLNRVLNQKVDVINKEKSKQPQDKDKISKLMANSITLTNQIENVRNSLSKQEENLASIEKKLFREYTSAIDSLSELLNQSNSRTSKENLTAQIFSLRERRLYLTQGNLKLSYNPENILSINTKSFNSSNDKKRIEEYLNNAFSEAVNKLNDVTFKLDEIEKTISLQKKAARFLEQTENEIKPVSKFSNRTSTNESAYTGNDRADGLSEKSSVSYNQLINQLSFLEPSMIKSRQNNSFTSNKKNFQLKDYKNLLTDVKQLLTEYRYLLSNKINSLK